MMYPRLKLARSLLAEDGVIFISIDDNEVHNLRKICDEVFGEGNFFAEMVVIRAEGGGLAKKVIKGHDYLLAFVKNPKVFKGIFKPKDIRGKVVSKNGKEFWIEEDWLRKEFGKYGTCLYEEIIAFKGAEKKKEIDHGLKEGKYTLIPRKGGNIVGRLRALDEDGTKFYSLIKHLNKNATKDMIELKMEKIFDFPKPLSLLKEVTLGATIFSRGKSNIILDFFSGSATTAHAVMQLNAEDGGNRKFIMVQLPEICEKTSEAYKAGYKTISDIGKERIRRAGEKIREEIESSNKQLKLGEEPKKVPDIGFRVLKVDSTNMKDVYYSPLEIQQSALSSLATNIKEDRTDLDLLYGVLLEWGLPLSGKHSVEELEGVKVHTVEDGALVACFQENVPESVVRAIAKRQPLRAVFRDGCFATSPEKINLLEIFKELAPDTSVKVL